MSDLLNLTADTFDATIAAHPAVLVDFWAPHCAPCVALAPTVNAIAKMYQGQLLVAKLDLDEYPEVAVKANVMGMPTLVLFKDGQIVETVAGVRPKSEYQKMLTKHNIAEAQV